MNNINPFSIAKICNLLGVSYEDVDNEVVNKKYNSVLYTWDLGDDITLNLHLYKNNNCILCYMEKQKILHTYSGSVQEVIRNFNELLSDEIIELSIYYN